MKKILILLSCIISFYACKNDLLDTYPYDISGSENMWTTESLADLGVIGIYNGLRYGNIVGAFYELDTYGVTSTQIWNWGWILWTTNRVSVSDGRFSGYWQQHYELISRANDAIANLHRASLTEEKYGRLMSESKFLRAYAYYRLNIVFDGVPVYLVPTQADQFIKARETPEKVWEVVITDLTDCINDPNFPEKYDSGNTLYGRATKGAAYALRGLAHLWVKDYPAAESDFKAVERSGYELFQGKFGDIFTEENERSPEMIFSFQCIRTAGMGNAAHRWYGTFSAQNGGVSENIPNTDFVDTYEWADGRPFDWEDVIPGFNSLTPVQREVYFLRDTRDENGDELNSAITTAVNNRLRNLPEDVQSLYLPHGNEDRILSAYTGRDPRLTESIITPYSTFDGGKDGIARTNTSRFPYYAETPPIQDLRTNSGAASFYYYYRKFVGTGPDPNITRDDSPIDIPIIRFSHALLGLAEALNEQGKTSEALTTLNRVRARAGVAELGSASQQELRERIRKESRWEFCGEAINYFEELRWDTYKEAKFFPGAALKSVWGNVGATASNQIFEWGDRMRRWPIPPVERERNPNLTPNPGWEN